MRLLPLLHYFPVWVTMILQKGRLFSDRLWGGPEDDQRRQRQGAKSILIMIGHPQIILPKLLQSLSGLLSFLAAALARKYVLQVSKSSRLPVPHFRAQRGLHFWTPSIFTRNKTIFLPKLIAFQKCDGHTYNARLSYQSPAHYYPQSNASR